MNAENNILMASVSGRGSIAYPKWRYIYFLLAAFDLMTVCAGLYLNHRIMNIYTGSVAANRIWADRVAAYSHLGELAAAVDAPGNDVFDTRNVQVESARMHEATMVFDLDLAAQQQDLQANLASEVAAPLVALLDTIAGARKEMTNEAERIFDYFREGHPELAGERMATMDRKYANLNTALLGLRHAVGEIQNQKFKQQMAAATDLQEFEYVLGLLIVLMVAGAMTYGHMIASQIQDDAEQNQRYLSTLTEAEARKRSILDSAADGIVTFDELGQIETFNHAAERMFAYEPGTAIGLDISVLIPHLYDCLWSSQSGQLGDVSSSPTADFSGDHMGRRRDGSKFPLELSVSKVRFGGLPMFTGIVRDTTDRNRTEDALRAAAAAEAASRTKSQFLAHMSHEIRTPLNGVLGMTEMLLDTSLTPTQRRFAETAYRSGESLLGVIGDILDFSKIEAGKLELDNADFNPRELVEEVALLMTEVAEKKGLNLYCHVLQDIPRTLRGDCSRLRQVLTNLVGNAIKFTERGEVVVEVSTQSLVANEDNEMRTMLHFVVKDTGIGIPVDVQNQLFCAFTQVDNSTTRRYGGTGLGLAISKELVERMGGEIGVRSAPGRGAEFWFTLGYAPAAFVPQPASDGFAGQRVLLLAQHPQRRRRLEQQLRDLGLQVRCAEDGLEGIALVSRSAMERKPFAIVLVDSQLPDMAPDKFAEAADKAITGVCLVLIVPVVHRGETKVHGGAAFHARLTSPVRQTELHDLIAGILRPSTTSDDIVQPTKIDTIGLGGVRVLLAEDNLVNQDVARTMLESFGCEVQAVDNGRKALAALQSLQFDIILMDCQMPEMGGYDATAEIRARGLLRRRQPIEAITPVRLPIIALTANAVKGDREISLAAGMDEHLVKPFSRKSLRQVIERWVLDRTGSSARAAGVGGDEAGGERTFDPTMLEEIRSNCRADAVSPVAGLIDQYVRSSEDLIAALRRAAEASNADGVARSAHSLRSGSAFLGAHRLARMCGELEREARTGAIHDATHRINLIASEYEELVLALNAVK